MRKIKIREIFLVFFSFLQGIVKFVQKVEIKEDRK